MPAILSLEEDRTAAGGGPRAEVHKAALSASLMAPDCGSPKSWR